MHIFRGGACTGCGVNVSGFRILRCPLLALFLAACGGGGQVDAPYESCALNEGCSQGTGCLASTLPASTGYTGASCTTGCNASGDCLQDLSNYAAICVNSQCYIQCPQGSSTCPYGTGCVTFTDQEGIAVDICTP
jgi:hypothetical protein